jgi:uncharacterized protein (PEP-CTERM system associated)
VPPLRIDALACAALIAAPAALQAQTATPPASLTLAGSVGASDNGGLSPAGRERSELITSIQPRLAMARRGAMLDLDLQAGVNLLSFANGTQRSGLLPDVRASARATLVEHLLHVEGFARVRQSEADPFGAREEGMAAANRRTEGLYQVSPSLEHDFSSRASLTARHTALLMTHAAGADARYVSQCSALQLEHRPAPVGAALELSREEAETQGFALSRFTLASARLRASLQLHDELVLDAFAGRERSQLLLSDRTDPLRGVSLRWTPGPRTEASATFEHRFFGQGGALAVRHRMPFLSLEFAASRQPVVSSVSLGVAQRRQDLRGLLDAILTTRYPDPAVRSGVVTGVMASRGLDGELQGPVDVTAEYPQLQSDVHATGVLLGARNMASLTLYLQSRRRIMRLGDLPSAANADSRQAGASFQFSRRLGPQLSAEAAVRWSRVSGLALREGESSDARAIRLTLTQHLSLRTDASAGVQHDRFTTTAAGQAPYAATLGFVGLQHRF